MTVPVSVVQTIKFDFRPLYRGAVQMLPLVDSFSLANLARNSNPAQVTSLSAATRASWSTTTSGTSTCI